MLMAWMMYSATVTKAAIITMNTAMRTCVGMVFLSMDMSRFDIMSTKVVASPMETALMTELETASMGQVPRTCTKTGFSFHKAFRNASAFLLSFMAFSLGRI